MGKHGLLTDAFVVIRMAIGMTGMNNVNRTMVKMAKMVRIRMIKMNKMDKMDKVDKMFKMVMMIKLMENLARQAFRGTSALEPDKGAEAGAGSQAPGHEGGYYLDEAPG